MRSPEHTPSAPDRKHLRVDIGRYLSKTGGLTTEQHGALLLLLMAITPQGEIPFDMDRLPLIAKTTRRRWATIWPAIAPCFVVSSLSGRGLMLQVGGVL